MATEDDNVNSGALGTLLSVGAFSTLGIALVVTALVRSEMSEEAEKKDVGADRPFKDLVAEQTAKLSSPAAYVDRGKGLVSLPIERAMELVVAGLKKDPNSATPPLPKDAKPEAAAPAPSNSGDALPAAAPAPEGTVPAPGAALPPQDAAADGEKKDGEKKDGEKKDKEKDKEKEKKDAPKPKPAAAAPVPKAPAPAAPAPAAPAPAPNGQ